MVELRQRARDAVSLSFPFLIFFNSKGDAVQLKEADEEDDDTFHTENISQLQETGRSLRLMSSGFSPLLFDFLI